MQRLMKNVAKKSDNFSDIDKHYAYAVFMIEKEFNVGAITEDFLAMKFWNLMDKENNEKYGKQMKGKGKGGHGPVNTMGR